MFDIGFWELTLISLVSLVILGPQRLPQTIRCLLGWVRRSKQVVSEFNTKLESELGLDKVDQVLHRDLKREFNPVQPSLSVPRVRPKATPPVASRPVDAELESKESGL